MVELGFALWRHAEKLQASGSSLWLRTKLQPTQAMPRSQLLPRYIRLARPHSARIRRDCVSVASGTSQSTSPSRPFAARPETKSGGYFWLGSVAVTLWPSPPLVLLSPFYLPAPPPYWPIFTS
jgi:hypothetical protein